MTKGLEHFIKLIDGYFSETKVFWTLPDLSDSESTESMDESPSEEMSRGWTAITYFDDKPSVRQIACGRDHCLFLQSDGTVVSIGYNDRHQLGIGLGDRKVASFQKVQLPIDSVVMDIQCGHSHNLALCDDGRVYSWGGLLVLFVFECCLADGYMAIVK